MHVAPHLAPTVKVLGECNGDGVKSIQILCKAAFQGNCKPFFLLTDLRFVKKSYKAVIDHSKAMIDHSFAMMHHTQTGSVQR